MKIFKSADDRYEQGHDFIKRKEYDKAQEAFLKAIYKGSSDSDTAKVMIALLDLRGDPGEAEYMKAVDILNKIYEKNHESEITFGLLTISCAYLLAECTTLVSEMKALAMPSSEARAEALFKAAEGFQKLIGPNTLPMLEFYKSISITGFEKANNLLAIGNEDLAESVVSEDPKKAAEYLHIALTLRRRQTEGKGGEGLQERINMYAKSAACWICGREVTGEMIHFVSMETEVTGLQAKGELSSVLPSFENNASIYVCKACFLAISKRADKIAKEYHETAMKKISKVEKHLNERIDEVESMMSSLEELIESLKE